MYSLVFHVLMLPVVWMCIVNENIKLAVLEVLIFRLSGLFNFFFIVICI